MLKCPISIVKYLSFTFVLHREEEYISIDCTRGNEIELLSANFRIDESIKLELFKIESDFHSTVHGVFSDIDEDQFIFGLSVT